MLLVKIMSWSEFEASSALSPAVFFKFDVSEVHLVIKNSHMIPRLLRQNYFIPTANFFLVLPVKTKLYFLSLIILMYIYMYSQQSTILHKLKTGIV